METTLSSGLTKVKFDNKKKILILGLSFLLVILGYLFISGVFVFKPLGKEVILTGKNIVVDDGEITKYNILQGDVVNVKNYVLWKTFEVKITEVYLGKEYNIKFSVPFWVNKLNNLKSERCANFNLSYKEVSSLISFYKDSEFVDFCPDIPNSAESLDLVQLQQDTFEMLTTFYREDTDEFPISLTCDNSGCDGTYTKGPHPWFRYAQFYNDLTNDSVSYERYLSDFDTYPAEDFSWKFFQYGNIVTSDSNPEVREKYLTALESDIHESYFAEEYRVEEVDYMYMTGNEPSQYVEDSFKHNYEGLDSENLDLTAGRLAYDVIALSYAYEMTGETKYLYALDRKLSAGHEMMYFQENVVALDPVDFKTSSCNIMFADVSAYRVTGNEDYLKYFDYVVDQKFIDYIYSQVDISDTETHMHQSPLRKS